MFGKINTPVLMKASILLISLLAFPLQAAVPLLMDRLNDEHARGQDQWIYNDFQKAVTEAKRTGKPIFVTFRCVPCKDCKAFDAEVAKGNKVIRELTEKHFISLRQVEMKGVDLSLFQFDYDLNWAAIFMNADGTIYSRYGTQSEAGADAYNSVESLEKTMRRVLTLHANATNYKKYLAGKRGKPKPYKSAMEMPGLEKKEEYRKTTQVNNCIHCHNIHDAENHQLHLEGRMTNDKLWRYPLPNNIGLEIDPKDGLKISRVIKGSPAETSGLRAGQSIAYMNDQLILSIADIQWVLHHLPNTTTQIRIRPWNSGRDHILTTRIGWKRTDISWRGSLWNLHPRLRVYMPPAKPNELKKLNLPAGHHALKVQWINNASAEGQAALKAGLKLNDFIIAMAGKPFGKAIDHDNFNAQVKLNYKSGQKLPLTLMRNGKRIEFQWPLQ